MGSFVCVGILVAVLLGAGCTSVPSSPLHAGPAPTVSPGTLMSPAPDTCTFEQPAGNKEVHYFGPDSCYFASHTPTDFLNDLRVHPDKTAQVLGVPEHWITIRDAEQLMQLIDSQDPASPVVSPLSSYLPSNQTSTVGNEALFLLEGYRAGHYPPALSSLYHFRMDRSEMRTWWDAYGKQGLPDEKAAIRLVQDAYPDLTGYPSESFPQKAIITQKVSGWLVCRVHSRRFRGPDCRCPLLLRGE